MTENLAQTVLLPRTALHQFANYFIDEFIFWLIRRFITTLPRKKSIRAGNGTNALSRCRLSGQLTSDPPDRQPYLLWCGATHMVAGRHRALQRENGVHIGADQV